MKDADLARAEAVADVPRVDRDLAELPVRGGGKGWVGGVRVSDGVWRLARARVSATGSRGAGKRGSIEGIAISSMEADSIRDSPFGVLGDVHGDGGDLELRLLLAIDPVFDVVDGIHADLQRAALGDDRRGCGRDGRGGKKKVRSGFVGERGTLGRDRAVGCVVARETARDAHLNRLRQRPRRPAGRGPLRYQRCCSCLGGSCCPPKCVGVNEAAHLFA